MPLQGSKAWRCQLAQLPVQHGQPALALLNLHFCLLGTKENVYVYAYKKQELACINGSLYSECHKVENSKDAYLHHTSGLTSDLCPWGAASCTAQVLVTHSSVNITIIDHYYCYEFTWSAHVLLYEWSTPLNIGRLHHHVLFSVSHEGKSQLFHL